MNRIEEIRNEEVFYEAQITLDSKAHQSYFKNHLSLEKSKKIGLAHVRKGVVVSGKDYREDSLDSFKEKEYHQNKENGESRCLLTFFHR